MSMQDEKRPPEAKPKSPAARPAVKQVSRPATAKPKKKVPGALIACILLIVIVGGAVAAVYFDIGGMKQMAASALNIVTADSSEYETAKSDYEAQMEQLDSKKKELSDKENSLNEREKELNTRDQEIAVREAAVKEAEDSIDGAAAREEYLITTGKIYEQMDAAKAAKALAGMSSTKDIAQILMHMAEDKAALIMEKLSAKLATQVTSEMVQ